MKNQLTEKEITDIIERFNTPVPRYTSYPTALEWQDDFPHGALISAWKKRPSDAPLSLYLHLPFCENQCLYCGCNTVISRRKDVLDDYLVSLFTEIDQTLENTDYKPVVEQLHFGGGTPNFLRLSDWDAIMSKLHEQFIFSKDIEQSIELDPMVLSSEYLDKLKELGFNRVSFGIQDIDKQVLEAVNRPQDIHHLDQIINHSRELNFQSVNLDFIYGLPHQNEEEYEAILSFIARHKPDRLAFFSYAHVPWIKRQQKRMDEEAMPNADEKMRIYLKIRERMQQLGYTAIGMDHFALPDDELSVSLEQRTLHRNFMGYSTRASLDLLAFGASAISKVQNVYAQNPVKNKQYQAAIAGERSRFEKGYSMTEEDVLRSEIIQSVMGSFYLDIAALEKSQNIVFSEIFADELLVLREYKSEGLLEITTDSLRLTESGTFAVRHIAKVFDAYRKAGATQAFSRGI